MHFAAFFSCSHLAAGLVSTQVVSSLTALFLSRLNSVYLGVNYLPVTYTRFCLYGKCSFMYIDNVLFLAVVGVTDV